MSDYVWGCIIGLVCGVVMAFGILSNSNNLINKDAWICSSKIIHKDRVECNIYTRTNPLKPE